MLCADQRGLVDDVMGAHYMYPPYLLVIPLRKHPRAAPVLFHDIGAQVDTESTT